MRLELHPEAKREAETAADWYEEQRAGQGAVFLAEVLMTLASVSERPLSYPAEPLGSGARHAMVRGAAFRIVFFVEVDRIYVVAVHHGARMPGYWRTRTAPP